MVGRPRPGPQSEPRVRAVATQSSQLDRSLRSQARHLIKLRRGVASALDDKLRESLLATSCVLSRNIPRTVRNPLLEALRVRRSSTTIWIRQGDRVDSGPLKWWVCPEYLLRARRGSEADRRRGVNCLRCAARAIPIHFSVWHKEDSPQTGLPGAGSVPQPSGHWSGRPTGRSSSNTFLRSGSPSPILSDPARYFWHE
jgi:hypothetical protein